jgi:hypothetical protein
VAAVWHTACIAEVSDPICAVAREDTMTARQRTSGERLAVDARQAEGGSDKPVEGITERTSQVNPDRASAEGGSAGPIGYFEGEGNEGAVAPLGGDVTKSAEDGQANSQGGVASGAPG